MDNLSSDDFRQYYDIIRKHGFRDYMFDRLDVPVGCTTRYHKPGRNDRVHHQGVPPAMPIIEGDLVLLLYSTLFVLFYLQDYK